MPQIRIDLGVTCMKCRQPMVENNNRCGEPNCECREYNWMHESNESIECDLDSQTL